MVYYESKRLTVGIEVADKQKGKARINCWNRIEGNMNACLASYKYTWIETDIVTDLHVCISQST